VESTTTVALTGLMLDAAQREVTHTLQFEFGDDLKEFLRDMEVFTHLGLMDDMVSSEIYQIFRLLDFGWAHLGSSAGRWVFSNFQSEQTFESKMQETLYRGI